MLVHKERAILEKFGAYRQAPEPSKYSPRTAPNPAPRQLSPKHDLSVFWGQTKALMILVPANRRESIPRQLTTEAKTPSRHRIHQTRVDPIVPYPTVRHSLILGRTDALEWWVLVPVRV